MQKFLFWTYVVGILTAIFALAACDSGESVPTAIPYPVTPPASAAPVLELPQPAAAPMLAYLDQADYQTKWGLWPGVGEKYQTDGPHRVLLSTYLSPPAYEALTDKRGAVSVNVSQSKRTTPPKAS